MSLMCSAKACAEKTGMCNHEKAMAGIVIVIGLAAMGHWVFQWF